jgi:hypothetical protein
MMKNKYLLILLVTLSANCLQAKIIEKSVVVNFETDKHELTAEHVVSIQAFINSISFSGDYELMIKGHTDQIGSVDYNIDLSERRAQSIKEHLIQLGADHAKLTSVFRGEFELLQRSFSSNALEANRRVEIYYKLYEFEDLSELENELRQKSITATTMQADDEKIVVGNNGTFIKIEPESFLTAEGNTYEGEVKLTLTEAINMSHFMEHSLATMADGELLESGGMYKLEATSAQGEALQLNPSSPLLVGMPSDNIQDGMSVFVSSDGTDWENTKAKPMAQNLLELPPRYPIGRPQYRPILFKPDKSKEPKTPYEPRAPKLPKKPNAENYIPTIKWYHFYKKDALVQKENDRYQWAMDKYDLKMEKYHDRYEEFLAYEKSFPTKLNNFYCDHDDWKLSLVSQKTIFNEVTLPAHRAEWKKANIRKRKSYESAMDEWREKCDSVALAYIDKMEELGIPSEAQTSRYIFSQANLGWMNIDRFYKDDFMPKREIIVSSKSEEKDQNVMLYFSDLNSCIPLHMSNGEGKQKNIPKSEAVRVFAYKLEGKNVMYCEYDASKQDYIKLNYKPISFTDFRKRISEIGKA